MIWSRYNYIFHSKKHGDFIFNATNGSFIKIAKDLRKQIESVQNWNVEVTSFSKEFQDILIKYKIIVDDKYDDDFYTQIKYVKFISAFSKESLNLTIATTTGCNFMCSYCYEQGTTPITMDKTIEDNILSYVNNQNSKNMNITWYGGEPLMNFKSIERLTKGFINLKKFDHINYRIVTNGYFLDEKKCFFFAKQNVTNIQVTLDGTSQTHNKSRIAKNGRPTFNRILTNLDKAINILPKCIFNIRVNINKNNIEDFAKLYSDLCSRWEGHYNFFITYAFVEDYGSCNDTVLNNNEKISFLKNLRENYKIYLDQDFPRAHRSLCCANSINSYVIAPDGNLYKCWVDIGKKDKCIGSIFQNKPQNYKLLSYYTLSMDKFNDDKCKKCFLLPVCSGGCPVYRYDNIFTKEKYHSICPYESINIDAILEMMYEDHLILTR